MYPWINQIKSNVGLPLYLICLSQSIGTDKYPPTQFQHSHESIARWIKATSLRCTFPKTQSWNTGQGSNQQLLLIFFLNTNRNDSLSLLDWPQRITPTIFLWIVLEFISKLSVEYWNSLSPVGENFQINGTQITGKCIYQSNIYYVPKTNPFPRFLPSLLGRGKSLISLQALLF